MRFYKEESQKFLLLSILLSSSAFSSNDITSLGSNSSLFSTLKQGHVVLEVGRYQASQGKAQHINIQDLIGDTFSVNDHHNSSTLLGIGYFVDGKKLGRLNMRYGVNAFYLAPTSVSGNVTQENLFTNLSYHYRVAHTPIYVMAQSIVDLNSIAGLVIDIGMGPNFVKAYNFHENSLDGGVTLPDNIFSSNTTTTFSATVGASIRFNHALGQLPLDVGYRFFYLGEGHFKPANNQVLNKLTTGDIYANALSLSINV